MRVDARLQGAQPGVSFGFDVVLPLVAHVEIAQGDQGDDAADGEMPRNGGRGGQVRPSVLSQCQPITVHSRVMLWVIPDQQYGGAGVELVQQVLEQGEHSR